MRQDAVRRLLVTDENGSTCGVVSIGDLAAALDPNSALGTISGIGENKLAKYGEGVLEALSAPD